MTAGATTRAAFIALTLLGALSAGSETTGEALSGEELFYLNCATCHVGASGLIGVPPPPDLFRDPLSVGDSPAALATVIRSGAGAGRMPAFAEGLTATETRELVAFIRSQRQR